MDEVDDPLQLFALDFRKLIRYCGVLEGSIDDEVTGGSTPSFDPPSAEVAITVEQQHGFVRRVGNTCHGVHIVDCSLRPA
jgi:hypothetical protein